MSAKKPKRNNLNLYRRELIRDMQKEGLTIEQRKLEIEAQQSQIIDWLFTLQTQALNFDEANLPFATLPLLKELKDSLKRASNTIDDFNKRLNLIINQYQNF